MNPEFKWIAEHVVYNTDLWRFTIDEYQRGGTDQFFLVHAQCKHCTPTALRTAKSEWSAFRKQFPAPLYAVRDDGGHRKWKHFITLFGFKPTGIHLPCNIGVVRELYISTVVNDGIEHKQH